jgi:hypothetical protein
VTVRLPGSSYLRKLHDRGVLLPIVVGLVVVAILVQGFLQRAPETDPGEPAAAPLDPTPTATPFRPALEKVPLTSPTTGCSSASGPTTSW